MKHTMAIIGFGGMGSWHYQNVTEKIPDLRVKGVYDIRQEALDKATSLGLHPYASLEELLRPEQGEVMEIPLTFPYRENSRALGLADMAKAIQTGRQHRANGELTFHVLEVMEAFAASGASHQPVEIHSRPRLTPPMPPMGKPGVLD